MVRMAGHFGYPKLCFYASPGIAIKEKDLKTIRDTFKNTEMVDLGEGLHFIQEDYYHEIGQDISDWYSRKRSSRSVIRREPPPNKI